MYQVLDRSVTELISVVTPEQCIIRLRTYFEVPSKSRILINSNGLRMYRGCVYRSMYVSVHWVCIILCFWGVYVSNILFH